MNIVSQVLLPLILAFIMFSMGLSLVVDDFKRVAKFPRAFLVGTMLQMLSLPFIAWIIASLWSADGTFLPEFAVGLMILAACPGGVTSNLMTHLGNGETALSISLTAILSIAAVITVPFIVNFGLSHFYGAGEAVQLPIFNTIIGIFFITTVPVLLGMLVKHKKAAFADRIEPGCRLTASVLFVLIVILAVVKDWQLLKAHFANVGMAALVLNVATMGFAALVARLMLLNKRQAIAITLECGLQNGTLAIFIAVTLLGNEKMMIPGGVYSLLMFATAFAYLGFVRKRSPASAT